MRISGGLAQLGEHLLCKQGVVGSIPSSSTILSILIKSTPQLLRILRNEEATLLLIKIS